LVKRAEKEHRSLTDDERRRPETALKEVQAIRDHKALTNMIEGFNPSSMGRAPLKSRGAPALDFSLQQVQEMHKAAQSAYRYKGTRPSNSTPSVVVYVSYRYGPVCTGGEGAKKDPRIALFRGVRLTSCFIET